MPRLIELMGADYPELAKSKNKICEILTLEEENFFKTLKRGGNLLFEIIKDSKKTDKKEISGENAFKLKDTYGFPLDEIMVIAKDENLEVDLNKFNDLEEEAKEKSKKARKVKSEILDTSKKIYKDLLEKFSKTEFIGYDRHTASGKILAIIKDGKLVNKIVKGDIAEIILDKTIFYAEKGGQEADFGSLEIENVGNVSVYLK